MAEDIMKSCVKVIGVGYFRGKYFSIKHIYKFLQEDFFMYVDSAYQWTKYAVFTVNDIERIKEGRGGDMVYLSDSEEDCVNYLMGIVNKYSVLNQD